MQSAANGSATPASCPRSNHNPLVYHASDILVTHTAASRFYPAIMRSTPRDETIHLNITTAAVGRAMRAIDPYLDMSKSDLQGWSKHKLQLGGWWSSKGLQLLRSHLDEHLGPIVQQMDRKPAIPPLPPRDLLPDPRQAF
jgi:hypothetical protein